LLEAVAVGLTTEEVGAVLVDLKQHQDLLLLLTLLSQLQLVLVVLPFQVLRSL
jgi:hypothetical protein